MLRFGKRAFVLAAVAAALAARSGAAQQPETARRRELRLPGLGFSPDGVWRRRAREVAAARAAALSRGDFLALNAAPRLGAPSGGAAAVTGALRVPAILLRFADTPDAVLRDTSQYRQVLFSPTPPAARPYSLRSFYEEASNGLFSVQGDPIGWVALPGNEVAYTGVAGTCSANPYGTRNPNGIFCDSNLLLAGLAHAVALSDAAVDFGQYDNDGPDDIPNSGDDDGYVDLVVFLQPFRDGAYVASGNNHIWSHQWYFPGGVETADDWTGHPGEHISVRDYMVNTGVGGDAGNDESQIMAIGTVAHELGHGLNLPDFYDTDPSDGDDSEGIGHWGLMGSGNYATPSSPAGFEALSRSILGWVTVLQLEESGTYSFGPSALGDTVFLVRPTAANPRGEYYLLENRQAVQSDTALIRLKGPGLLVWHVDSAQYASRFYYDDINSGPIHGLVLIEAGGVNNLLSSTVGVRNRGDANDPFPGAANVVSLNPGTNVKFSLNSGGGTVSPGFVLDQIEQRAQGEIRLRLCAECRAVAVAASDTAALIRVGGQAMARYRSYLAAGDTLRVSVDSLQTNGGNTQYRFLSWSDGGAREHLVTAGPRDTTITASVGRSYDVRWTVSGPGAVTATPGLPATGSWVPEGDSVVLVARADSGAIFMGWTGSVTSSQARVAFRALGPFGATAGFSAVSVDSVVRQLMFGTGLTSAQVAALDAAGNGNGHYDLGDFVAWLDLTGTAVSAEVLADVFRRVRQ